MIKPMSGEKYEREFEEATSKRLLEDYEDFKKIIIPIMMLYANKIKDVHKSIKITANIEACEVLNKQFKEYFNKKRSYSVKELEEKNETFLDTMTNLQQYYQEAITLLDNNTEKGL